MLLKKLALLTLSIFLFGCERPEPYQYQGYVEGDNIFLASPYSGVLQTLAVKRGQMVKKGDLLYKLDPNPEAFQLETAKKDLLQAENTLQDLEKPRRTEEVDAIIAQIKQVDEEIKLASIRVDRYQKLYAKQAAAKDTLDAAIASLERQKQLKAQYKANLDLAKLGSRVDTIKAQQAQVESLAAKVKALQWAVDQKTGYAPAEGIIFNTFYDPGEWVGEQKSIVSLLTPDEIRIEFFMPLKDMAKIKRGQKISFACEGCDSKNVAMINYISPRAEYLPPLVYSRDNSSKLVFRIKAQILHPLDFKPGQPVWVSL
jgi:HlyD family secretion protein